MEHSQGFKIEHVSITHAFFLNAEEAEKANITTNVEYRCLKTCPLHKLHCWTCRIGTVSGQINPLILGGHQHLSNLKAACIMLNTFKQKCYSSGSEKEVGKWDVLRGTKEEKVRQRWEWERGREGELFLQCERPIAHSINCRGNKQDLSHLNTYVPERGV